VSRKSIFSAITFGLLAVATTSCGGGEAPKPTESKAPQAAANDTPAASSATVAPASNFSQPLVAAKEAEQKVEEVKTTDAVVAGLLPGSDSDSVVRGTTKGRSDPFAAVVLNTITSTKTTQTASAPKTTLAAPSLNQPAKIASVNKVPAVAPKPIPKTTATKSPQTPGIASVAATLTKKTGEVKKTAEPASAKPATSSTIAIKPVNTPGVSEPAAKLNPEVAIRDIPAAAAPAPLPQPTLAKAISVSGVSQVNGQTQVIVKLPTESFSRYVSVGERLMNGKVLVKSVQEFSTGAPIIILEEAGIEVSRSVGDKPVTEKEEIRK
jgi:hypothetical protein